MLATAARLTASPHPLPPLADLAVALTAHEVAITWPDATTSRLALPSAP
ncbi:hypothetical protein [Kitasatospora cheerisanensis]|uniref:Uncharacterized protein n=1 Tax=Kitasatospora cheerisanensis KCTC 2395 TaxID=1348663 RepID=A0A066Z702_9ACTN|nr:hypothetical protein [Kitasatospora cheerisanensis]KDN86101.1 hypothetical protein KCH_19180 [Kitasatospora cheerisanensis KCTC 2395]